MAFPATYTYPSGQTYPGQTYLQQETTPVVSPRRYYLTMVGGKFRRVVR